MANKSLFRTSRGALAPETNTVNEAGGKAYSFTPKHALAQFAATGVFNTTYYASAEAQLNTILQLLPQIDLSFIAKTAVYSRNKSFMKDMPAFLAAYIAAKDGNLLRAIFPKVINNGKMLRNFVQFVRSGVVGRKSFGSGPRNMIRNWITSQSDSRLFNESVGNDPSLADIIKMVHPKPKTKSQEALFAYILDKNLSPEMEENLPVIVKDYEAFKKNPGDNDIPDVNFQMLTSLDIPKKVWKEIAKNAGWHMLRMNLNTFARHGVLEDSKMVSFIADKLRDAEEIEKARVFPYQLFAAFQHAGEDVPNKIKLALQDAMELAIKNVPFVSGNVVVCPDVSGSMSSPATGIRMGATTKIRCIDIAALVTAAMLRNNQEARVLPFEEDVKDINLNPRDSVMTNASKLSRIGGGGTNCSAPLEHLVDEQAKVDLVLFVSDNESWVRSDAFGRGTGVMNYWNQIKQKNPKAKMVCIDIQPYNSTQATDREDILNIGGFSDTVFEVISAFVEGKNSKHWVDVIEAVEI